MPYVELGAFMDRLRDKESPRLTATTLTKGNRAMTYLARARLRTSNAGDVKDWQQPQKDHEGRGWAPINPAAKPNIFTGE